MVEPHIVDVPGGHLSLVLHLPDDSSRVPCLVACHGLGASKESDKYLLLGNEVPAAGIALARFDFRGCGESSGCEEDTTISTRIEDVEAVLASLAGHPRLSGECALLGSSLGGFVALHVAAVAVVTWNAPADLHHLGGETRREGLGAPFYRELATGRYASTPAGIPRHLVVQGAADDVVPVAHGKALHARAADPCDILIIPDADHRLTAPDHRRRAVAASIEWIRRFLTPTGSPQ